MHLRYSGRKTKRSSRCTPYHNSNLYTLFAVVNHQGKMDTGHYTMFAKHRGQVHIIVVGGMVYPQIACPKLNFILLLLYTVV